MRILIIEDEPLLAGHVCRALTRVGHTCDMRHDGAEGLKEALQQSSDLIVLDVNLPSMDGFTILKKMREAHVHTRVILLTARGEVGDKVFGLRHGADDYLTKPFAMEELLARVDVLGRRGAT